MASTIFDEFATFFDELPDTVRRDLSFMMIMLSEDAPAEYDPTLDIESAARGLFRSSSRLGRVADLLKATAICDVYFALDNGHCLGTKAAAKAATLRRRYAARREAIDGARRRWQSLRLEALGPGAIGAALI